MFPNKAPRIFGGAGAVPVCPQQRTAGRGRFTVGSRGAAAPSPPPASAPVQPASHHGPGVHSLSKVPTVGPFGEGASVKTRRVETEHGSKSVVSRTTRSGATFGQNTISSHHLSAPTCEIEPNHEYSSAPFFQVSCNLVLRGDARVNYVAADHGVTFSSPLVRVAQGLGLVNEGNINMTVGGYNPNLVLMLPHRIMFDSGVATSTVDISNFQAYIQGGIVSDRNVGNALNAFLGNQTVARQMAGCFLVGLQRFDNLALYMKGAFYALLMTKCQQEGLQVVYPPLPADVPIQFLDLMAADTATTVTTLTNAIIGGVFILITDVDFNLTDLDIVSWLAASGRRVGPNAAPSFACMAVTWPAIPFLVLRKGGPVPAIPAANAIPPARIWAFLQRFALTRAERDSFVAGVYESAFLVNGVSWLAQNGEVVPNEVANRVDTGPDGQLLDVHTPAGIAPANQGLQWYCFVSALYETFGEQHFPRPLEYNALHRLVGITREEDTTFLNDYVCFGHTDMLTKVLHVAILAGFSSVFVTTVLASFNTYGTVIQQLAVNAAATPALFRQVADYYGFFRNASGTERDTASIFTQTSSMLDRHLGGMFPASVMAYRNYNLPVGGWGFLDGPFIIVTPHHPPRLGDPLSIFSWLELLPSEWGVIDAAASVDFRNETFVSGPPAVSGWYAEMGDPSYKAKCVGDSPYGIVPYGALAMNAISQAYINMLPAGAPPFTWLRHSWDQIGLAPPAQELHPHPPVWVGGNHHHYEPCTVITYVWENEALYAPFLTRQMAGDQLIWTMANMECVIALGRGFEIAGRVTLEEGRMTFKPMPGLMKRSARPPPSQPPPGGNIVPPDTVPAVPVPEHNPPQEQAN